jgi:hypothetical protein
MSLVCLLAGYLPGSVVDVFSWSVIVQWGLSLWSYCLSWIWSAGCIVFISFILFWLWYFTKEICLGPWTTSGGFLQVYGFHLICRTSSGASQSLASENWLIQLLTELENQGITLPERWSFTSDASIMWKDEQSGFHVLDSSIVIFFNNFTEN